MKTYYEYNENKKVKCFNTPNREFPLYPYTYNKKTRRWENRSGQLSRQRINQLENENKLIWY